MAKKVEVSIDPQLIENLKAAKEKLKAAQEIVLAAQSEIWIAAERVLGKVPEKGTIHCSGVKVVTGFYEKWNQDRINDIEQTWVRKSNLPFPFKKEWKPDGKSVSYIRENAQDAYAELATALTLTPKKPSFTLEGEKEDE